MDPRTIIDISPLLSENIAPFPGDVPFRRSISKCFSRGDTYELSAMETSLHVGAHADAPLHYHGQGQSIEQRSLAFYLGPCQVIEPGLRQGEGLSLHHVVNTPLDAPRVLVKTNSFADPNRWRDDFCFIEAEVIAYLAQQGVMLVGIDTPSVDPRSSSALPCHQAIFQHNLAILEGLDLRGVSPGSYTLIALPLRIAGADASPVRAVLLPL